MQLFVVFAAVLVAAAAQEFVAPSYYNHFSDDGTLLDEQQPVQGFDLSDYDGIRHPRFRRGVSMDPNTGAVTADHKTNNGRVFGTLGSTDTGLYGKGGYEHNIFNDHRGVLNANAHGQRNLSPYGDSTSMGGGLNWQNKNAAASFDLNKQIHGGTSWTAGAGGKWPVGRNGDFGLQGTYSHFPGGRSYGGMANFGYRF